MAAAAGPVPGEHDVGGRRAPAGDAGPARVRCRKPQASTICGESGTTRSAGAAPCRWQVVMTTARSAGSRRGPGPAVLPAGLGVRSEGGLSRATGGRRRALERGRSRGESGSVPPNRRRVTRRDRHQHSPVAGPTGG